jgi:hypothetical protein
MIVTVGVLEQEAVYLGRVSIVVVQDRVHTVEVCQCTVWLFGL